MSNATLLTLIVRVTMSELGGIGLIKQKVTADSSFDGPVEQGYSANGSLNN